LLSENYELYQFIQKRIVCCENEIEKYLQKQAAPNNEGIIEVAEKPKKPRKKKTKDQPIFDVKGYFNKIYRVDVSQIFGINEGAALEILAETGSDLSDREDEHKFVSWLNLCP
jgi:transposase